MSPLKLAFAAYQFSGCISLLRILLLLWLCSVLESRLSLAGNDENRQADAQTESRPHCEAVHDSELCSAGVECCWALSWFWNLKANSYNYVVSSPFQSALANNLVLPLSPLPGYSCCLETFSIYKLVVPLVSLRITSLHFSQIDSIPRATHQGLRGLFFNQWVLTTDLLQATQTV